MSATRAGRNLTKSFLLVLGGSAVVAGAILTSFGLYRELASGGDTSVPSLASQHRTDPGGIYDRPLGVVRAPAATPEPVVAAVPEPPLPEAAYHIIIDKIGENATVFTYRASDPVFGGDYTNRRVVRATFSRLTQPVAAVGG